MPPRPFVGEFHELCSERPSGKPAIDVVLSDLRLCVHFAPNLFIMLALDDKSSAGVSN